MQKSNLKTAYEKLNNLNLNLSVQEITEINNILYNLSLSQYEKGLSHGLTAIKTNY